MVFAAGEAFSLRSIWPIGKSAGCAVRLLLQCRRRKAASRSLTFGVVRICFSRPAAPGGGGTLVYLRCDDCAVELARVEAAGGKIHRGKFPIGEYGHCALIVDTEGNLVGLHSMR